MVSFFINPQERKRLDQVAKELRSRYEKYQDPWGFNLETSIKTIETLLPFYQNYFRVRVFGKENLPPGPVMVVSNHTGQIPIDGILITMAFAFEMDPPRFLRGMIERFLAGLPFLGELSAQTGGVLGDRNNCQYLLKNGESILVFPEGVKGISKSTMEFYELQKFTHGFFRISLDSHTPIIPVAVIGAEEMYPFVLQSELLPKLLNLKIPRIPLTPFLFPLPSPIDIYIGKPFFPPKDLSPDAPEREIKEHVYQIQGEIKKMISHGLKHRRSFFDQVRLPLTKWIKTKRLAIMRSKRKGQSE